jgi:phage repressor protein C with HTH and peptisase S24 domain
MTPGKRIKKLRIAVGLTQEGLANALGQFGDRRKVSRTTIAQWESDSTRGIEAANLIKTARVLNVSPEWLQFGTGAITPIPPNLDGLLPVTCNARSLPLLDSNANKIAGSKKLDELILDGGGISSFIGIDMELANVTSNHAFALKVTGNSMLPEFKPGDIIVVDPNASPQPGEIVAAKLEKDGSIVLRKYRPIKKEIFELIALNKDWPKIIVDSKNPAHIIGTLIEHRCRRRLQNSEDVEIQK